MDISQRSLRSSRNPLSNLVQRQQVSAQEKDWAQSIERAKEQQIEEAFAGIDNLAEARQILLNLPDMYKNIGQQKLKSLEQQRNMLFDKHIGDLSTNLKDIQRQIQLKRGRGTAGLEDKELQLKTEISKLSELRNNPNVDFSQANKISVQAGRITSIANAQVSSTNRLISDLSKSGINVNQLISGDLQLSDLSPSQLSVLKQKNLVTEAQTLPSLAPSYANSPMSIAPNLNTGSGNQNNILNKFGGVVGVISQIAEPFKGVPSALGQMAQPFRGYPSETKDFISQSSQVLSDLPSGAPSFISQSSQPFRGIPDYTEQMTRPFEVIKEFPSAVKQGSQTFQDLKTGVPSFLNQASGSFSGSSDFINQASQPFRDLKTGVPSYISHSTASFGEFPKVSIPSVSTSTFLKNFYSQDVRPLQQKGMNLLGRGEQVLQSAVLTSEERNFIREEERLKRNIDKKLEDYNSRVNDFNSRYGAKSLTQEEYSKAIKESEKLSKEQQILTNFISQSEEDLNEKKKKINFDETNPAFALVRGGFLGGASTPFFVGGSVISPTQTGKVYLSALKTLPSQIKSHPFTIAGSIIGSTLAFEGLRYGVRATKNPILERTPLEVSADFDPFGFVSKPKERRIFVNELGETIQQETGARVSYLGQIAQSGSKVKVTTPFRDLFGGKSIYEGVYSENPKGYAKALKLLKKKGYTDYQARNLLRLQRPRVREEGFSGDLISLSKESGSRDILTGKLTRVSKSGIVEGVKYLEKKPETEFITDISTPSGSKKGVQYFDFERSIMNPEKPLGKKTRMIKGKGGSQGIKEGEIFNLYKTAEITRQINPKKNLFDFGGSKVMVQKGEPDINIIDTSVQASKGFMGRGKSSSRSSPQYFENLYGSEQKASQVLNLIKKTPQKSPSSSSIIEVSPSRTPQTSAYTGLGLYERTEGGASPNTYLQPTKLKAVQSQSKMAGLGLLPFEVSKSDLNLMSPQTFERHFEKEFSLVQPKTQMVQKPREATQSKLREKLQAKQMEATLQAERTRTMNKQIYERKAEPKIKIYPHLRFRSKKTELEDFSKKKKKGFLLETRRFGRWLPLGRFKNKKEAELFGYRKATSDLSASLRLSQNKKVIPFSFIPSRFRPSKREKFVVIQKSKGRGGRLASFGERREIQSARRRSLFWKKTK